MVKTDRYRLYLGDCVRWLETLQQGSVDICITDIPYGIDYESWDVLHKNANSALGGSSLHQREDTSFHRRGKPLNGWSRADRLIPYEYEQWCNTWSKPLYNVLKDGSPVLLFSSRRLQHRVCNALEDTGFIIRDILIWKKNHCNAKAQRVSKVLARRGIHNVKYAMYRIGNLAPYYEPIIYAMKPYKHTVTDCILENGLGGFIGDDDTIPSNILEVDVNKRNQYHPTEKPVELIEKLIHIFSLNENQTILDFTMGSGTTGVACMKTKRCFIGIEKEMKYFEVAKERLDQM